MEMSGSPKQIFAVKGSTGAHIYKVEISHRPSCTCPDHAEGHSCKHILFIFLRVLRVRLGRKNPVIWQKALKTKELQDIFAVAPAKAREPDKEDERASGKKRKRGSDDEGVGGGGECGEGDGNAPKFQSDMCKTMDWLNV
jgi:uncharacterized Zn finger protein